MPWPFIGRRERLRRQASGWAARLNGPHDEHDRAAFERWYRERPEHAAAYDRVSALFEMAGKVRPAGAAPVVGRSPSRRPAVRYALAAAAAVCIAVLAFAVLGAGRVVPSARPGSQTAVFAANADESRQIALVDASRVVLSPGSELKIAFDGEKRRLLLTRGEARFIVAHDPRPFIVTADGTEIVARGTQFVVRLGKEGTLVSLIEGRVEVSYPQAPDQAGRRVARLEPGHRIIVPANAAPPAAPVPVAEPSSRRAMIVFDDTPLADAIERVSEQTGNRIRLSDPALADLRVTGAFRARDAAAFAESAAVALGLELRRGADGTLWLRAPPGRSAER